MTTHVVKQGEYLSLIAEHHGFRSWRTLYDHPDNAGLRRKRPNPNVLHPGDEIAIPMAPRAASCWTRSTHKFVVTAPERDELIVVLRRGRRAIASTDCTVTFSGADGSAGPHDPVRRKTSPDGELRVPIPRGARHARIAVPGQPRLSWDLTIGHLDPIRDMDAPFDATRCKVSGIQARLNNLGFHCGHVDGLLGGRTRHAIRSFQSAVLGRSEPDGNIDQETCDGLETHHGS